jgi:hypothetical protein
MPRKIAPLVLALLLIVSACSKKADQSSGATPPNQPTAGQSATNTQAPPSAPAQATAPPASTQSAPAPPSPPAAAPPKPMQSEAAPPPPPPPPKPVVIPAGTVLTIRTSQALSSKTSQTGQTFVGSLERPVSVGGLTALRKGADVSGTVVAAKEQGKIKGEGELDLALTNVVARGQTYDIKTKVVENTVKGKGKRTAVTTGGGAAGGALIGGLAGGGKGAGIGALVGAGAGLVGGAMTGNKPIELPAESVLTFTLSEPLTLPPPDETGANDHGANGHQQ